MKIIVNIIVVFFSLSINAISSCQNGKDLKEEFSSNFDTTYFSFGGIKSIERTYVHNINYKVYTEFYENGKLKYKGGSFRDKWVGPIEYYDSNGIISLYNEVDWNGNTFYVQKFAKGKIIKEEGLALSPEIFDVSISADIKKNLFFIYAQPRGYINEIEVLLDNKKFDYFNFTDHHIGLITLDSNTIQLKNHDIIVNSKLIYNGKLINNYSTKYHIN
jgi:hypothetical protein